MSRVEDVAHPAVQAAAENATRQVALRAGTHGIPGVSEAQINPLAEIVDSVRPDATTAQVERAVADIDAWRRTHLAALGAPGTAEVVPVDRNLAELVDAATEALVLRAGREGLPFAHLADAAAELHQQVQGHAVHGRPGRRRAKRAIEAWRRRLLAAQDVELRRREREAKP